MAHGEYTAWLGNPMTSCQREEASLVFVGGCGINKRDLIDSQRHTDTHDFFFACLHCPAICSKAGEHRLWWRWEGEGQQKKRESKLRNILTIFPFVFHKRLFFPLFFPSFIVFLFDGASFVRFDPDFGRNLRPPTQLIRLSHHFPVMEARVSN